MLKTIGVPAIDDFREKLLGGRRGPRGICHSLSELTRSVSVIVSQRSGPGHRNRRFHRNKQPKPKTLYLDQECQSNS